MAKDETRRISPQILSDDKATLDALGGIANYTSTDGKFGAGEMEGLWSQVQQARANETRQEAALKTARDAATAVEWEFHNAILHVKEIVIAQFGKDSDEVQAIGLKKKSEYSRPSRSGATEPAPVQAG